MAIEIRRLAESFAGEVSEVDLARPDSAAVDVIKMTDVHDTLNRLQHPRYADVSYHSPAAPRLIAAALFAHLKPLSP